MSAIRQGTVTNDGDMDIEVMSSAETEWHRIPPEHSVTIMMGAQLRVRAQSPVAARITPAEAAIDPDPAHWNDPTSAGAPVDDRRDTDIKS